jgi:hypothetical protein
MIGTIDHREGLPGRNRSLLRTLAQMSEGAHGVMGTAILGRTVNRVLTCS